MLKSQGQWKLPGFQETMVTICTYNARTPASEFWIEDAHASKKDKYATVESTASVFSLTRVCPRTPIHSNSLQPESDVYD
ncbi:unnamed protein product [Angiostrongylus costaricensis]|uniref:Ig-like domain-containing protein n=1 Tax=Angiostrongylus costaricensis TaxID=334426 RepID=A0A0R3PVP7_ANGCS|nr:unnamed protein product [Angiostrongylus costaricensis]